MALNVLKEHVVRTLATTLQRSSKEIDKLLEAMICVGADIKEEFLLHCIDSSIPFEVVDIHVKGKGKVAFRDSKLHKLLASWRHRYFDLETSHHHRDYVIVPLPPHGHQMWVPRYGMNHGPISGFEGDEWSSVDIHQYRLPVAWPTEKNMNDRKQFQPYQAVVRVFFTDVSSESGESASCSFACGNNSFDGNKRLRIHAPNEIVQRTVNLLDVLPSSSSYRNGPHSGQRCTDEPDMFALTQDELPVMLLKWSEYAKKGFKALVANRSLDDTAVRMNIPTHVMYCGIPHNPEESLLEFPGFILSKMSNDKMSNGKRFHVWEIQLNRFPFFNDSIRILANSPPPPPPASLRTSKWARSA